MGGPEAELAFCGDCGARIRRSAKFCTACGVSQEPFEVAPAPQPQVPTPAAELPLEEAETQLLSPPEPSPEPAPPPLDPKDADLLLEELLGREDFQETAAPVDLDDGSGLHATGAGAIGELAGLPVRVDRGEPPGGGSAAALRIRIGLPEGNPDEVAAALADAFPHAVSSHDLGVEVTVLSTVEDLVAELEGVCSAAATAAEVEGPTRLAPESRLFTIAPGFPWWVETTDVSELAPFALRHLELAGGHATWEEADVEIVPTADGALAPDVSAAGDLPLTTLMGRIAVIRPSGGEPGEGTPVVFGSGVCVLTERRLVGVLYERPDDDAIEGLGIAERLEAAGITAFDAAGRRVDPLLSLPESHKVAHFVDQAGSVCEDGCGVVQAFSAPAELFRRAETQGGLLQRGFGIPTVVLAGERVEVLVQPFRVLDANGRTVKPRRGAIAAAVERFAAGPGGEPACRSCDTSIAPDSRFCPACGAPQAAEGSF